VLTLLEAPCSRFSKRRARASRSTVTLAPF
jgi:hypothetical protein